MKKIFNKVTLLLLAATSCGFTFGMNKNGMKQSLIPVIVQIKQQEELTKTIQIALIKATENNSQEQMLEASKLMTQDNFSGIHKSLIWKMISQGDSRVHLSLYLIVVQCLTSAELQALELSKTHDLLDLFLFTNKFMTHSHLFYLAHHLQTKLEQRKNISTQSGMHAQRHRRQLLWVDINLNTRNLSAIKNMCLDIHRKEKAELKKGRFCFYHGQKTYWWLRSYIFKKLMEICYNKGTIIEGYIPLLSLHKPGQNLPFSERARILENGRQGIHDRHNLLFMCIALFGGKFGSCSMEYFIQHVNVNNHTVDIKTLFAEFGLKDVYENCYKERIEKLEKQLSRFHQGIMYLISATEEQIQKSFYFARTFGYKEAITINDKPTRDVVQILKTLRHSPVQFTEGCNTAEVCAIMTDGPEGLDLKDPKNDGLLNPFNDGMRAYYYAAENLKPIIKELDAIFDEINFFVHKSQHTKISKL